MYILPLKEFALEGSFPSKTWSIFACGSALVVSAEKNSEYAQELERDNKAYISTPNSINDMINNINKALKENRKYEKSRVDYIKAKCDKESNLLIYKKIFDELVLK